MRRSLALVALVLTCAACAAAPRPEGQVERWLRSLNQGAAGAPGELADPAASEAVVPGWAAREPETIDLIVVGTATDAGDGTWTVPFSIHEAEGRTYDGTATVDPDAAVPIVAIAAGSGGIGDVDHGDAGIAVWMGALLLGLAIAVAAAAFVGLVGRRAARAA